MHYIRIDVFLYQKLCSRNVRDTVTYKISYKKIIYQTIQAFICLLVISSHTKVIVHQVCNKFNSLFSLLSNDKLSFIVLLTHIRFLPDVYIRCLPDYKVFQLDVLNQHK